MKTNYHVRVICSGLALAYNSSAWAACCLWLCLSVMVYIVVITIHAQRHSRTSQVEVGRLVKVKNLRNRHIKKTNKQNQIFEYDIVQRLHTTANPSQLMPYMFVWYGTSLTPLFCCCTAPMHVDIASASFLIPRVNYNQVDLLFFSAKGKPSHTLNNSNPQVIRMFLTRRSSNS